MRFVLAVGVALLVACGNPSEAPHFNTGTIVASDDQFVPAVDTVVIGQLITWTFPGSNQDTHNVTWNNSPDTSRTSGNRQPGAPNYQAFFGATGTYSYYCAFHASSGMVGTVTACQPSDSVSGGFNSHACS
jgi:plastocyanin